MPGKRLNDTEKRLKDWWDSQSTQFPFPILKGISVKGTPGLRGITDIKITFNYPLTVICGQNGSGKTTLLCLSALAFHAPIGHHSYHARNYDAKKPNSYYTFVDFFFKGIKDPDITGVEINWDYKKDSKSEHSKTIRKQTNKWMKSETRPKRPVHYFGASRVLPAIERNVLRGHFRVGGSQHKIVQLNEEFRKVFCQILGRNYSEATVIESDKYSVRSCTQGSTYTSFNMGAGEDVLLELLYYLQVSPKGSLIVIEEIELGLHPEAQKKFAQELIKIIGKKQLQVIVSSHSSAFIDSVPREARILIQRASFNTHNVVKSPTTRYAMSFLDGVIRSELIIYCEDSFAEKIINSVLDAELRKRVDVVGVGDINQVARQCGAHIRAKWPGKYLGVFDGDVGEEEMDKKMKNEVSEINLTNCFLLPDNLLPPEKWVIKEIINDADRLESMRFRLRESSIYNVKNYLDTMDILPDHHDICYELAKHTGLHEKEIESILIDVACVQNEKLNPLREKIDEILAK